MEYPTPPLDTSEVVGGLTTRWFEGPNIHREPLGKAKHKSNNAQVASDRQPTHRVLLGDRNASVDTQKAHILLHK